MITRTKMFLIGAALIAIYWLPALAFADEVRSAVNASFFLLSLMMSFVLLPDIWDIVKLRGDGLTWQALVAKCGLFLLTVSFSCARVWALIIGVQDFPAALLHSPTGSFFVYTMGLGLGGLLWGFSSVGDGAPKMTTRTTLVIACLAGIAIGLALSHIQF